VANTINKDYGSGGSPQNPHGGQVGHPSFRDVLQGIADDHAVMGLIAGAPTTPSTQASGTGATSWHVNLSAGEVNLARTLLAANTDGDFLGVALTADYDVYSSGIGLAAASQSVYARLIAKNVTGTISLEVVMGTPAAAGSEAIPSNAAVQTQVGATVPWCDIALCHLARNSGTTLTQTEWNGYRLKTRKGTQD